MLVQEVVQFSIRSGRCCRRSIQTKVAPAASASFNETDAVNSVAQGKSAMVPVWWWRYANLTDPKTSTLKPEQVGFVPLPSMPGKDNTTYTNTWFYGINRNSKRKDAAMEFLTWLTQPGIERDLLLDRSKNEVVAVQNANLVDAAVNQRFDGSSGHDPSRLCEFKPLESHPWVGFARIGCPRNRTFLPKSLTFQIRQQSARTLTIRL